MKKLISLLLLLTTCLSLFAMTSCGSEYRLGLGVIYNATNPTDALGGEGDEVDLGVTTATYTVCAMTLDKDGKIVACTFDTLETKLQYSHDGKAVEITSLKTKREQGKDYGMVAWGGSELEWFEQADAFATVLVGKTKGDIASLATADGKGNSDVITAGCTITVSDFVKAAEKAYAAAESGTVVKDSAVTLSVNSTQTKADATADANGNVTVNTTFEASVGGNKVSASYKAAVTFDPSGKATVPADGVITAAN